MEQEARATPKEVPAPNESPTMTIKEVLDLKRSLGLRASYGTERAGIIQGVYPYGIRIERARRDVYDISRPRLMEWLRGRGYLLEPPRMTRRYHPRLAGAILITLPIVWAAYPPEHLWWVQAVVSVLGCLLVVWWGGTNTIDDGGKSESSRKHSEHPG